MLNLPFFRYRRLPGHVAHIKRRPQRLTVRYVFPSVCFFVVVVALVLLFFAHPSGENDDKFLGRLPVEKSGVRPLYDSKDSQYLTQYMSSLDIPLGTHL